MRYQKCRPSTQELRTPTYFSQHLPGTGAAAGTGTGTGCAPGAAVGAVGETIGAWVGLTTGAGVPAAGAGV